MYYVQLGPESCMIKVIYAPILRTSYISPCSFINRICKKDMRGASYFTFYILQKGKPHYINVK